MTLLRVIVFAVLLAMKMVVPLTPAPHDDAEEALGSEPSPESEREGVDDDSDVVIALSPEAALTIERYQTQSRAASRPDDLPAAPEDRPPNA
ncbi:MAG: hypothetical protein JNK82_04270 [Myxococcaceae bacterium]|nr:hypothetical protein [Myxococcaceae bacterium]